MEQALQQWRLAYGIEESAFESLIAVISTHGPSQENFGAGSFAPHMLSPGFLSNANDGVLGQNEATSYAPTMSQLWQSYAAPMLFPVSEVNSSTSYICPTHSAGAARPSNAIVSEPVEDSAWSPITAQKKNHPIACVKCWAEKKKCDSGTPCKRCIDPTTTRLPRHLCLRVRLVNEGVFSKWVEPSYKSKLIWESLQWSHVAKSALLTHEQGGPTLQVNCREFFVTSPDQILLFWKEATGWGWMNTTAYSLETPKVDLASYIDEFSSFYLQKASEKPDYLGQIFRLAQLYPNEPIIRLALRLWAANRLLMKGWEIRGHERLGMDIVSRFESPLYGSVPVPRVLQNQLDHLLEAEIVKIERYLLKNLQKVIRASNRSAWVSTFLGIAIILHVMERDTWRLLYWVNHQEQVNTWRHPLRPTALVEKSVHFSNLLLAHFHYAARGLLPLALDWNDGKQKELVSYDTTIIASIQSLQRHAITLKEHLALGQKGRDRYLESDENSLDFTLSSLVLVDSVQSYAKLGDFVRS